MPAAPPATVGGTWCEAPQIVMHGYCNPYPPDWDDEGDVCANDDMPDQAYCAYTSNLSPDPNLTLTLTLALALALTLTLILTLALTRSSMPRHALSTSPTTIGACCRS